MTTTIRMYKPPGGWGWREDIKRAYENQQAIAEFLQADVAGEPPVELRECTSAGSKDWLSAPPGTATCVGKRNVENWAMSTMERAAQPQTGRYAGSADVLLYNSGRRVPFPPSPPSQGVSK